MQMYNLFKVPVAMDIIYYIMYILFYIILLIFYIRLYIFANVQSQYNIIQYKVI